MKLSRRLDWFVVVRQEVGHDAEGKPALLLTYRIRWWHPGLWLALLNLNIRRVRHYIERMKE